MDKLKRELSFFFLIQNFGSKMDHNTSKISNNDRRNTTVNH